MSDKSRKKELNAFAAEWGMRSKNAEIGQKLRATSDPADSVESRVDAFEAEWGTRSKNAALGRSLRPTVAAPEGGQTAAQNEPEGKEPSGFGHFLDWAQRQSELRNEQAALMRAGDAQGLARSRAEQQALPGLGEELRAAFDSYKAQKEAADAAEQDAEAEPDDRRPSADTDGPTAVERVQSWGKGLADSTMGSLGLFWEMLLDPEVNVDAARRAGALYGEQMARAAQGTQAEEAARVLAQRAQADLEAHPASKVYTPEESEALARFVRGSEELERAKQGLGKKTSFAVDTLTSMAQNAPAMALALIPGVGPFAAVPVGQFASLGMMGAMSAGSEAAERSLQGEKAVDARSRGAVAGLIETGTEVLPVSNWADIVKGSGRSVVRDILSQALGEASEEAVGYVANYITDVAEQDPDAEFSLAELTENALMGAASGAGFGVLGHGINRAAGALAGAGRGAQAQAEAAQSAENTDADMEAEQAEQAAEAPAEAMPAAPAAPAPEEAAAMQTAARAAQDPQGLAAQIEAETDPARGTLQPAAVQQAEAQRTAMEQAGPAVQAAMQAETEAAPAMVQEDAETAAAREAYMAAVQAEEAQARGEDTGTAAAPAAQTAEIAAAEDRVRQRVADIADNTQSYTDEMKAAVKEGYRGGSPLVYLQAMDGMYNAGRTGAMSFEQAMDANRTAAATVGDPALLYRAYALGQNSVNTVTDAQMTGSGQGRVTYAGGAEAGSTSLPAQVYDAVAQKLGIDVQMVRRLTDGNGNEVNGSWAAGLARLTVGENSGNGYQTLVHEVTHYIGSRNAEGWAKLRSAALSFAASERGMNALQRDVLDRYQQSYGSDSAVAADEAARDIWSGILSSEEGMRSFLEYLSEDSSLTDGEKRGVLETLKGILERVIETVRGLLRGGDATVGAAEGRRLAERADNAEKCLALVEEFLHELDVAVQNEAQQNAPARAQAQTEAQTGTDTRQAASEAVKFSLPEGYESLERKMNRAIPSMEDMEPVSTVDLKNAAKEGMTPLEIEADFFESVGGSIYREGLGSVQLTRQGARNDVRHGIGPVKMATLYAVPDVIQKGKLIDTQEKWKGRNYRSYTIMAPVAVMQGKAMHRTYVAAIVREYINDGKRAFYLHEVLDTDGKRVQFAKENETSLFNKTGLIADETVSADTIGEVSNNNISDSAENVKHSRPVTEQGKRPRFTEDGQWAFAPIHERIDEIETRFESITRERSMNGQQMDRIDRLYKALMQQEKVIDAAFADVEADPREGDERALYAARRRARQLRRRIAEYQNGPRARTEADARFEEAYRSMLAEEDMEAGEEYDVNEGPEGQRYSRPDAQAESRTQLERENRELAWQVSRMEEQIELLRQETKLSGGHTMSRASVRGTVSRLLREYSSKYDRATLEQEIHQVFEKIANDPEISWEEAMETCTNLMRGVLEQSEHVSTELRDYYQPVREALRGRTIEIREGSSHYNELMDAFGDGENGKRWGNVRRHTFGRLNLKLVQGPGNADSFFAEMAQMYPDVFDADDSVRENVERALGVFEASEPVYENPYGMDLDEAAVFAGQELFEAYMNTPERHTYADRQHQQLLRMRGEFMRRRQQALQAQKSRYEAKLAEVRAQSRQSAARQRQRLEERHAAELAGAREQSRQSAARQRQRLEERHAAELAGAREQSRQTAARVRQEMTDKMLKQKAIFEQRMERRNEGMRWRQARDGVQKSVRQLQRWLQNPTDQAHVQDRMRKAVLDLLTSFDWNTSREGSKNAVRWQEAMKDLRALALEMDSQNRGDDLEFVDFDPDLPEMINELVQAGRGTGQVSALSAVQMQQLRGVLESVTKSITEANKLMAGEHARDLRTVAESSIVQMDEAKNRQLRAKNKLVGKVMGTGAAERVSQLLGPDMMDAGYYFRSLGDAANSIYRNIRDGFDKRVWHLKEAQDAMADILKGHDISTWTGPKAKAQAFLGGKLKLTTGQVMELYCLTQREQAREHLLQGGVTVDVGRGKRNGERVRLKAEDIAAIVGSLTPEQVLVAKAMQEYLSTTVAEWGNEVSMAQYGTRKFGEKFYWPIKSNQNFTRTSDASVSTDGLYGIKNKGFTKTTQIKANNPIILHDAFDTWSGHVAEMATYNAWCIPLTDAMKWYNWRGENEISVKEAIENLYGAKGKNFFVQLMKDINGSDSRGGGTFADSWNSLQSRWKVAKVGANLRVAIQQPTAYFRAGAVLSPKHLTAALAKAPLEVRRGMNEALQYCAIAQWKNWGYFETNIGQSMRSILTGEQTAVERIQDKSTALAELGDSVTWGTLWLACEGDVQERMPELKPGSEAFKQEVARRLSEVIDRTQVVDTVLHRSQIMRSKDTLAKWATNFMAEPTKTWNLMREAAVDMAQGKQGARAKFARTMATFVVTALGTAAAAGLVDAMRSAPEEPDKEYLERYAEALAENFADNLNLINNLPFVKDILSLMQGYDVSRNDMEATADTIDAAAMWLKTFDGKGEATTYKLIYRTANALSEWTGLPVGGLIRELKSGYDILTDMQDPLLLDEKIIKSNADMKAALEKGDTEHVKELMEEIAQKKTAEGKTADDIRESLRGTINGVYKDAYVEGTPAERKELQELLMTFESGGEKLYTQKYLNDWLDDVDRPAMHEAIGQGDKSAAQKHLNALRSRMLEEGKTEKDARSSLKNSLTSYWKPKWQEADTAERKQIEKTLCALRCGELTIYEAGDFKKWDK